MERREKILKQIYKNKRRGCQVKLKLLKQKLSLLMRLSFYNKIHVVS